MPLALVRGSFAAVVPHEGAWIEMCGSGSLGAGERSPLTKGRGLKCGCAQIPAHRQSSPLTKGRGLKFDIAYYSLRDTWSPLTKGRGLKCRRWTPYPRVRRVAPHEGAWIEIPASALISS